MDNAVEQAGGNHTRSDEIILYLLCDILNAISTMAFFLFHITFLQLLGTTVQLFQKPI